MSLKRLKVGDTVQVIAGKAKGSTGQIIRMKEEKVYVGGVNMLKKAVKPNPDKQEQGGIKEIEGAIHRSNVMLYDSEAKKAFKFGVKTDEKGERARFNKSTGKLIDKEVG